MNKKVNSDDLIYKCKGNTADAKFDKFDNALNIINKIQNVEISLADVKNYQEKFKSYLGEEKRKQQKNDYDDCSLMMPEAKAKAKATKGTGL